MQPTHGITWNRKGMALHHGVLQAYLPNQDFLGHCGQEPLIDLHLLLKNDYLKVG